IVTHLADRFAHAPLDDLVAILAAVVEALAQGLLGRRQDEDRFRLGHQPAYLLRALPVDLQDQVVTFGEGLLQPALGGAIEVAEYFGMLEEFVPFEAMDELLAT